MNRRGPCSSTTDGKDTVSFVKAHCNGITHTLILARAVNVGLAFVDIEHVSEMPISCSAVTPVK
eukprot:3467791-Amphidinium_carterae.1